MVERREEDGGEAAVILGGPKLQGVRINKWWAGGGGHSSVLLLYVHDLTSITGSQVPDLCALQLKETSRKQQIVLAR